MFEDINLVRWVLSVIVLALLLGGLALIAPHIGKKRGTFHIKGKKKKLKLIETLYLDSKRKVIIFKAGDLEHTILAGPHDDIHLAAEPLDMELYEEEHDMPIGFLREVVNKKELVTEKTAKPKQPKTKKEPKKK